MKTITVRSEGIVLDAILASEFGPVRGRALVARTLELNPGLAAAGPVLPLGSVVVLPDAPATTTTTPRVVSLFG